MGIKAIPLFLSAGSCFRRPRFLRGEGEGAGSSGGVGGAFAQGSEVAISWETHRAQSRYEKTVERPRLHPSKGSTDIIIIQTHTHTRASSIPTHKTNA